MSIRTINSPGIEIIEKDLSQVGVSMTGTNTVICGFSSEGKSYVPVYITTKEDAIVNFGKPSNEAERYFHYSIMNVLNEGGTVIAIKLPYTNNYEGNYMAQTFSVNAIAMTDMVNTIQRTYGLTSSNMAGYTNAIMHSVLSGTACKTFLDASIGADLSAELTAYYGSNANGAYLNGYIDSDYIAKVEAIEYHHFLSISGSVDIYSTDWALASASWADESAFYDVLTGGYAVSAYLANASSADAVAAGFGVFSDYNIGNLSNSLSNTCYQVVETAPAKMSEAEYNALQVGTQTVDAGTFTIVADQKNIMYPDFGQNKEGIFVSVVGAYQGLMYQRVLAYNEKDPLAVIYPNTSGTTEVFTFSNKIAALYNDSSVSESLMSTFPTIETQVSGNVINTEQTFNNWITVNVCKTALNSNASGKLDIQILESFSGSLKSTDVDVSTGQSVYIGNIINNNSNFVRFYGNVDDTVTTIKNGTFVNSKMLDLDSLLSFSSVDTIKLITGPSIGNYLDTSLEKVSNIDADQVDIICDGGLSTIAAFTNATSGSYFDLSNVTSLPGTYAINANMDLWRATAEKIINFASNIRRDCIAVVDGPRNLVLKGNAKVINPTDPTKNFSNTIGMALSYIGGLNSNYGAMYINWAKMIDAYKGIPFWVPPSSLAAGIYVRTDRVANIWDAPFGFNRGVLGNIVDTAFNPKEKEAGQIYSKAMNYIRQYPKDGFILEGQKTLQVKPSAFDRINVRRMFLRLERYTYQTARYFVGEPNNYFTRSRLVSTLNPMFQDIQAKGGMYAYKIICDATNNTPQVIDNNELRLTVGIQPVRTAEFIICTFVASRTGSDFSELAQV